MGGIVTQADCKGRVGLPGFAKAQLIVERVSANEYRVKKAKVIAEDDLESLEQPHVTNLSEKDALMFLELLNNPPPPTEAAKDAAREYVKKYGHPLDHRKAQ